MRCALFASKRKQRTHQMLTFKMKDVRWRLSIDVSNVYKLVVLGPFKYKSLGPFPLKSIGCLRSF